jgi:hypothetical protein
MAANYWRITHQAPACFFEKQAGVFHIALLHDFTGKTKSTLTP